MHKHNRLNAKQLIVRISVAAVLLLLSSGAWAAVQLDVDRTRITEGETVTLTFRTDDAKDGRRRPGSGREARGSAGRVSLVL
jgi:hypothetical protein